jgi:hypothetical protein
MDAETHRLGEVFFEVLPKVLPGLLVPAAQYGWQMWRNRNLEIQKQDLRQKIVKLDEFLRSGVSDSDAPEATQAKAAAVQERREAIVKLAGLSSPSGSTATAATPASGVTAPAAPSRTRIRRWFLLYAPHNAWGWIGRAIFFASILAVPFSVIGVLTEDADDTAANLSIVIAAWIGFALFGRAMAFLADRAVTSRLKGFRKRWLLAFRPQGIAAWMIHIAYYPLFAFSALGLLVGLAMLPSDPDAPFVLLGYVILSCFVLLLRVLALRLAESRASVPSQTAAHEVGQSAGAS